MRFLHCADLHIDRAFEGLPESITMQNQLMQANEQTLQNIVDLALAEQVDAVLLVGDTFHQNIPSLYIQHQFNQQMQRLAQAEIPVFLSFGNHDYYTPERYWFTFPDNVYVFTSEAVQTFTLQTKSGKTYAVSGFSYEHPWLEKEMVAAFPTRMAVDYHIGLYHGQQTGKRYAPFQLTSLKQKGYDYWALGHIHVPTVLSEQKPVILYPGCPQGHTRKEQQTGVVLVELTKQGCQYAYREVAALPFKQITISLKDVLEQRAVPPVLMQALQTVSSGLYQIRLTDTTALPEQWLQASNQAELLQHCNWQLSQQNQAIYVYDCIEENEVASFYPLLTEEDYQKLITEEPKEALEQLLIHRLGAVNHLGQWAAESFDEIYQAYLKELKKYLQNTPTSLD